MSVNPKTLVEKFISDSKGRKRLTAATSVLALATVLVTVGALTFPAISLSGSEEALQEQGINISVGSGENAQEGEDVIAPPAGEDPIVAYDEADAPASTTGENVAAPLTDASYVANEGAEGAEGAEGTSDAAPAEGQATDAAQAEQEAAPEAETISEAALSALSETDISSNRLIVGTADASALDAENIVAAYEDVYLLQFANAEETAQGFLDYYETADFITPDVAFSIAEDNSDPAEAIINTDNVFTEDANPFAELEAALEEDTTPAAKQLIALIDTGAEASENVVDAISVIGNDASDENGHGNRMVRYITSQNENAEILSIKALGKDGRGDTSAVIAAIYYAIENKANIINLSLSTYASEENAAFTDAVHRAVEAGITVVGAAGNQGYNAKYYVPGNIEEALIVGACSEDGQRIKQSNFGETVDYNLVAGATSEAAAYMSGFISANGEAGITEALNQGLIFETGYVAPAAEGEAEEAAEETPAQGDPSTVEAQGSTDAATIGWNDQLNLKVKVNLNEGANIADYAKYFGFRVYWRTLNAENGTEDDLTKNREPIKLDANGEATITFDGTVEDFSTDSNGKNKRAVGSYSYEIRQVLLNPEGGDTTGIEIDTAPQVFSVYYSYPLDPRNKGVEVNTTEVTFNNTVPVSGSYVATIKKVDADTKQPLAGAGFAIYDSNNTKVATAGPTDENGIAKVVLPAGTYKVEETLPPYGYEKAADTQLVVGPTAGSSAGNNTGSSGSTDPVSIYYNAVKGEYYLNYIGSAPSDYYAFTTSRANGGSSKNIFNNSVVGTNVVDTLNKGDKIRETLYIFEEALGDALISQGFAAAPSAVATYVNTDALKKRALREAEQLAIWYLTANEKPANHNVTYGYFGNAYHGVLAYYIFNVWYDNFVSKTSSSLSVTVPSNYTAFAYTKTTDGDSIADGFQVVSSYGPGYTTSGGGTDSFTSEVTIEDKKSTTSSTSKQKVTIHKKDSNGNYVPGAQLKITNKDGSAVTNAEGFTEWPTQAGAGHDVWLPAGEYKLTETVVPSGYEKSDDVFFTVAQTNAPVVLNYVGNMNINIGVNGENIVAYCMDKYTLMGSAGSITDATQSNFTTVDIDSLGNLGTNAANIKNNRSKIIKTLYLGYGSDASNLPVHTRLNGDQDKHAKYFQLATQAALWHYTNGYDLTANNANSEFSAVYAQDSLGPAIILSYYTRIINLVEGSSYSVPNSFQPSLFTGTKPNSTDNIQPVIGIVPAITVQSELSVTMIDPKVEEVVPEPGTDSKTGELTIKKVDEKGEPLKGAELRLSRVIDGKKTTVEEWETDGSEKKFTNMPVGSYILEELDAPEGYRTADPIEFDIRDRSYAINYVYQGDIRVTDGSDEWLAFCIDMNTQIAAGSYAENPTQTELSSYTSTSLDDTAKNNIKKVLAAYEEYSNANSNGVPNIPLEQGSTEKGGVPLNGFTEAQYADLFRLGAQCAVWKYTNGFDITTTNISSKFAHLTGYEQYVVYKYALAFTYQVEYASISWTGDFTPYVFTGEGCQPVIVICPPGSGPVNKTIVMTDKPEAKGQVELTKQDENGTVLPGAQFVLRDSSGKIAKLSTDDANGLTTVSEFVLDNASAKENGKYKSDYIVITPNNGKIVINGLKAGTYEIEEIAAPTGYTLAKEPKQKFTIEASYANAGIEIGDSGIGAYSNSVARPAITITYNSQSFRAYCVNLGYVTGFITKVGWNISPDSNVTYTKVDPTLTNFETFMNQNAGSGHGYTDSELNEVLETLEVKLKRVLYAGYPNDGCGLIGDGDGKYSASIVEGATRAVIWGLTTNIDKQGALYRSMSTMTKDELKDVSDCYDKLMKIANGELNEDIDTNKITLELFQPSDSKYQWLISISYGEATTQHISITNESQKTTVQVLKVDENDQPLEGAELVILNQDGQAAVDVNGNTIESWITTGEAKSFMLSPGRYILRELAAPSVDYLLASDQEFTVDPGNSGQTITVTMANKLDRPGRLVIDKLATGSKIAISGAVLELYRGALTPEEIADSEPLYTWTSDGGSWVIDPAEYGTYTLHEASAPDGYEKAEDIIFTYERTLVQQQHNGGSTFEAYHSTRQYNDSGKTTEYEHIMLRDTSSSANAAYLGYCVMPDVKNPGTDKASGTTEYRMITDSAASFSTIYNKLVNTHGIKPRKAVTKSGGFSTSLDDYDYQTNYTELYNQIKRLLWVGYPNDALGIKDTVLSNYSYTEPKRAKSLIYQYATLQAIRHIMGGKGTLTSDNSGAKELLAALLKAANDSSIVVPSGVKLEIYEPKANIDKNTYQYLVSLNTNDVSTAHNEVMYDKAKEGKIDVDKKWLGFTTDASYLEYSDTSDLPAVTATLYYYLEGGSASDLVPFQKNGAPYSVTLTYDNEWKGSFVDLPFTTADGKRYIYVVKEGENSRIYEQVNEDEETYFYETVETQQYENKEWVVSNALVDNESYVIQSANMVLDLDSNGYVTWKYVNSKDGAPTWTVSGNSSSGYTLKHDGRKLYLYPYTYYGYTYLAGYSQYAAKFKLVSGGSGSKGLQLASGSYSGYWLGGSSYLHSTTSFAPITLYKSETSTLSRDAITDARTSAEVTLENQLKTYEFEVYKYSTSDGAPTENALSTVANARMNGTKFTLTNSDTHESIEKTVGSDTDINSKDGWVIFKNLVPGQYVLEETYTLPGFESATGAIWNVSISYENGVVISENNGGIEGTWFGNSLVFTVPNVPEKYTLPATGGMGTIAFAIGGGLLILVAAGLFLRQNGRKKSSDK